MYDPRSGCRTLPHAVQLWNRVASGATKRQRTSKTLDQSSKELTISMYLRQGHVSGSSCIVEELVVVCMIFLLPKKFRLCCRVRDGQR